MTEQPFVSIIIPVYNSAPTLSYSLPPLQQQNYPADRYECILVDDGSDDELAAALTAVADDPRFTVLQHKSNRGLAAARNTGIARARGEILIFLDADLEVLPDFIERMVSNFGKPQRIGVLARLLPAPENPYDKYQRYLYEGKRGAKKSNPGSALPYRAVMFNITALKREALEREPGFDEAITSYGGEDTELAYRLSQHFPQGFIYDPTITAVHHHYREFRSVLTKIEEFGQRVIPYLIRKHPAMGSIYGLEYLNGSSLFKRLGGCLLQSKLSHCCLSILLALMPFPLSNGIIKLRMASALLRGIAKGTA